MTDLKLAGEFPPARREDWLKLVEQALKGAPLDETLVARTYDGLRIEALSERAAEAHAIAGARGAAPWQVLQRVDHPDPGAGQRAGARGSGERGAAGSRWCSRAPSAATAMASTAPRPRSRACSTASISTPGSPSSSISARRTRMQPARSLRSSRSAASRPLPPISASDSIRWARSPKPARARRPGAHSPSYSPPPSPAWRGKASAGRSRSPMGA